MEKEMNYDEKVRIFRFKNELTVKEALSWLKNSREEGAFKGAIELGNCNYLEGWEKDFDAIFNKTDIDGTKIYKNSTREWKWKRFGNQKVNYLIITKSGHSGHIYEYLANNWAFDLLMKQIEGGKKYGTKYLIETEEINLGE